MIVLFITLLNMNIFLSEKLAIRLLLYIRGEIKVMYMYVYCLIIGKKSTVCILQQTHSVGLFFSYYYLGKPNWITLNLLHISTPLSVLCPYFPGEGGGGDLNTPQPPVPQTLPQQSTNPVTLPTPVTENPPPSGLYFLS